MADDAAPATSRSAVPGNGVKVGIVMPIAELRMDGATARWTDIVAMARRAEAIGADSIWLPDHLLFQAEETITGQWEAMALIAGLAAQTARVEIGTLVACTSFRPPALMAKIADTIDEISDGRLILGLGAGWNDVEYRAFGLPFDHRASRFEEALTIIHGLLRHGHVDLDGRYYQVRDCELRPRAGRAGGPPIMIGTRGERMLRLTARYAEAWNTWLAFGVNLPTEIPPLRAAVDAACHDEHRDPATLSRTAAVMVDPSNTGRAPIVLARGGIAPRPITGTTDAIAERLYAFVREGIDHLQVHLHPNTLASIDAFAPVLTTLRSLKVMPTRPGSN